MAYNEILSFGAPLKNYIYEQTIVFFTVMSCNSLSYPRMTVSVIEAFHTAGQLEHAAFHVYFRRKQIRRL